MVPVTDSRGALKWSAFAALAVITPLAVFTGAGPFAILIGAVAGGLGLERSLSSWRNGRWPLAGLAALCVAFIAGLLVLPVWCHASFHSDDAGQRIVDSHCHRAWLYDHIH